MKDSLSSLNHKNYWTLCVIYLQVLFPKLRLNSSLLTAKNGSSISGMVYYVASEICDHQIVEVVEVEVESFLPVNEIYHTSLSIRSGFRTQSNIQNEAKVWNCLPHIWLSYDSPQSICIYINCSGAKLKITIIQ